MEASPTELRVLGALLEKQRLTPDVYPLTLNALRAACNQSTARDPVMSLDDDAVRDALAHLARRRWTRMASASRAPKYRHLLDETLGTTPEDHAVLAVLLLRGPQTAAELRARTERMHHFSTVGEVEDVLQRLADRELVRLRERRPGEKEARWVQLMGGTEEIDTPVAGPVRAVPMAAAAAITDSAPPAPAGNSRVAELEEEVAGLRSEVSALREEVSDLRGALAQLREELGA
jgi:hypothetical protein